MKPCLVPLLLTALLPSAMASAQTMDFACPDPGTTFTFDSGTKVVARAREGMACNMDIVGGTPFKMRALLFANPAPDGADTSAFIAALRPNGCGHCRSARRSRRPTAAGGQNWDYILTVARYEKRTGPRRRPDRHVPDRDERSRRQGRALDLALVDLTGRANTAIRFDYSDGGGRANRAVVTSDHALEADFEALGDRAGLGVGAADQRGDTLAGRRP